MSLTSLNFSTTFAQCVRLFFYTFTVINIHTANDVFDSSSTDSLVFKQILSIDGKNGHVLGTWNDVSPMWSGGILSKLPPSDRVAVELGAQSWYVKKNKKI